MNAQEPNAGLIVKVRLNKKLKFFIFPIAYSLFLTVKGIVMDCVADFFQCDEGDHFEKMVTIITL